jgi:VIT1/CCC1 family predicted Fe2+/Mn2+ transporter
MVIMCSASPSIRNDVKVNLNQPTTQSSPIPDWWNLNKQGYTESGELKKPSHVWVGSGSWVQWGGRACRQALTTVIFYCSAGLILVIYFFFYASLAAVVTLCMYMLFLTINPYMPTFTERVKPPGECTQMPCVVRTHWTAICLHSMFGLN